MRIRKISKEAISGNAILKLAEGGTPYLTKKETGNRVTKSMTIQYEKNSAHWQDQDVDKLFQTGVEGFTIPVIGSTGTKYRVRIDILGFLEPLKKAFKDRGFSAISAESVFRNTVLSNDIRVKCECMDFATKLAYWAKQADSLTLDFVPAPLGAPVRNPGNTLGIACKHIIHCLKDREAWVGIMGKNLFNFIKEVHRKDRTLFDLLIRPALDITDDEIFGRPIRGKKPIAVAQGNTQGNQVQGNGQPQATSRVVGAPVGSGSTNTSGIDGDGTTSHESLKINEPGIKAAKAAKEGFPGYYSGQTTYDTIQNKLIENASSNGITITDYITPQNGTLQISTLINIMKKYPALPADKLKQLGDPDMSVSHMEILAKGWANNLDLFPYAQEFDSKTLEKLFKASQKNFPLEKFALKGYNSAQIGQLLRAYSIDNALYNKLVNGNYNYTQMRDEISIFKDSMQP